MCTCIEILLQFFFFSHFLVYLWIFYWYWRISLIGVIIWCFYLIGLRKKHQEELDNLTLTTQPLKTLKLFAFAVTQWIHQTIRHRAGWFMFSSTLAGSIGILVTTIGGPHKMVWCYALLLVVITSIQIIED